MNMFASELLSFAATVVLTASLYVLSLGLFAPL